MIGSLCLPIEIADPEKIAAYQSWLEYELVSVLRSRMPDTYEAVIGYIRQFIETPWVDDDAN